MCILLYYWANKMMMMMKYYYSAPDSGTEYCDDRVCLYVCLSAIISSELHVRSSRIFFIHATYGRGSVLLWRYVVWYVAHFRGFWYYGWRHYLHISYNWLVDVAAYMQLTRSPALGYKRRVGIPVAGNGRTGLLLVVGLGGSTGGAESAVYDCIVLC